jgi:hypothetical protein
MPMKSVSGSATQNLGAFLRDRFLLCFWVFSYRVILSIFGVLRRLESRGPISVGLDRGKSST